MRRSLDHPYGILWCCGSGSRSLQSAKAAVTRRPPGAFEAHSRFSDCLAETERGAVPRIPDCIEDSIEHRKYSLSPDLVRPGKGTCRIVHPEAHREIDAVRCCEALEHGLMGFVHQHRHGPHHD